MISKVIRVKKRKVWKVEGDGKRSERGKMEHSIFLSWEICVGGCVCVFVCVHTCILVMCTKEVSVHCYLLRSRSSFLFTFVPKVGMVSLEHINKPGLSPRIVQQDKPSRIRVVFWSSSF